jgi:hypothetical protein
LVARPDGAAPPDDACGTLLTGCTGTVGGWDEAGGGAIAAAAAAIAGGAAAAKAWPAVFGDCGAPMPGGGAGTPGCDETH